MFTEHTTPEGLVTMSSSLIPAVHAFSTRYGGVSGNGFETMNVSLSRGDTRENVRENYRRWCSVFGAGVDDCCVTNQVHGNTVAIVTAADRHVCLSEVPSPADGLVTGEKNLPIFCFTADCVPAILWDAEGHAAGAIRCGWKSSVADILFYALSAMQSLGAQSKNIRVALGPSIGRCCFETDADVPDAITRWLDGDTAGLWSVRDDGKYMVDLRLANARRLTQLGVPVANIDISRECTMCSHEKYWSARYTAKHHQLRGTLVSGIVLS